MSDFEPAWMTSMREEMEKREDEAYERWNRLLALPDTKGTITLRIINDFRTDGE